MWRATLHTAHVAVLCTAGLTGQTGRRWPPTCSTCATPSCGPSTPRSLAVRRRPGRPRPHRLLRRPAAASPTTPGTLTWEGGSARVVEVRKDGDGTWHRLEGDVPPVGRQRPRRDRLGAPPRPHAHPHRAARAVRGDLERVVGAGHRREHGAAVGPHGLRVRPAAGGLRAAHRGAGQRRAGRRPPDRGVASCPGRRRRRATRTSSARR